MLRILTVCGNGIGSSLMLAMKIEEICKEEGNRQILTVLYQKIPI